MSEMVEFVARAICADLVSDWEGIKRENLRPQSVIDARWPDYATTARAAIEAIRDFNAR